MAQAVAAVVAVVAVAVVVVSNHPAGARAEEVVVGTAAVASAAEPVAVEQVVEPAVAAVPSAVAEDYTAAVVGHTVVVVAHIDSVLPAAVRWGHERLPLPCFFNSLSFH